MKKILTGIIFTVALYVSIPVSGNYEMSAATISECDVISATDTSIIADGFSFKIPDESIYTFFGESITDDGMTMDGWVDKSGAEILLITTKNAFSEVENDLLSNELEKFSLAQIGSRTYGKKAKSESSEYTVIDGVNVAAYTWIMNDWSTCHDCSFCLNDKIIEIIFVGTPETTATSKSFVEYADLIKSIHIDAYSGIGTIDDYVALAGIVLESNYGKGCYGISYDDEAVTINVWRPAIGQASDIIILGDAGLANQWQSMIDGTQAMAKSECDTLHVIAPDMHLRVNVLDDRDLSNVLLTFYDGELIYDITK